MSLPQEILPIPTATDLFGAKVKQLARFCVEPVWSAYNPSICYTEEHGFLVLLRSSNGYLKDHREDWQAPVGEELNTPDSYVDPSEWYANAYINAQLGSEKLFRNRMFIAKFNPSNLTLGKIEEIDLTAAYNSFPVFLTRGIEDGRLYHNGKGLRISATIFESGKIGVARMCNLDLDLFEEVPKSTTLEMFDSPVSEGTVEKNWMPVHKQGINSTIDFDYIYNSGKTYTIADHSVEDVGGYDLPIRGGSQLVELENGTFLAVIHQTVSAEAIRFANIQKEPLFRRRYAHRFIQYNDKGQILKVTDKFNFLDKSIEFASGLAIKDGRAYVSFGALDSSAHIASIPLKNILSALRPPIVAASGPEN
jgi:predicted GH43/DUF377 family glycosyl hydrolase